MNRQMKKNQMIKFKFKTYQETKLDFGFCHLDFFDLQNDIIKRFK